MLVRAVRHSCCRVAFSWCWVAICICLSSAAAADEYADRVAGILQQGWLPNSLPQAEAEFASAAALSPKATRADYALALVQMRHQQWPAATSTLDAAAAKAPTDPYIWRARVWLKLCQRDFNAALDDVDAFAKALPPADETSSDAIGQAVARIMGRVYGYLAGPRTSSFDAELLTLRREELLAIMNQTRRDAFTAGEAQIATEHQQYLDAIAAEQAQTLADNEAEKVEQQEQVDSEKVRIEEDLVKLQEQEASAKNLLDEDISKYEQELAPIRQSYALVQAQARPFQIRIQELQARLNAVLAETQTAEGGKDEQEKNRNRERRERAQRQAEGLQFELRREQEFLRPYVIQAQQLEIQAAAVEQKKVAALASYQATVAPLNAEARKLQRTARLLKATERQAGRTPSNTSAKIQDMRARLPLWPTYEKFPLEEERTRLLTIVRGK